MRTVAHCCEAHRFQSGDTSSRWSPPGTVVVTACAQRETAPPVHRWSASYGGRACLIGAYVPDCLLSRLRGAFGTAAVLAYQSMEALADASRYGKVDVVVIDPVLCPSPDSFGYSNVSALPRGMPVFLYTHASPSSLRLCFAWARAGARQLLLADVDDETSRLRELLASPPGDDTVALFLERLTEQLTAVPPRLAGAIHQLFTSTNIAPSLATLAADAFMTHRSVDRWLRRAGLAPPKHFLGAARLLRTHGFFARGETSVARAARSGGFPSKRSLVRHTHTVLGISPSVLRSLHQRDLHDRLLTSLRVG